MQYEYKRNERIERALSQTLYLLDENEFVNDFGTINRVYSVTGNTDNIYQVVIATYMTCTCIDYQKHKNSQHLCKHILFVLIKKLHVDENSTILQNRRCTTYTLNELFKKNKKKQHQYNAAPSTERKEWKDNECIVCLETFQESENNSNRITWCKAQCGQNIHTVCFKQWKKSTVKSAPTCPYCRIKWKD